MRVFHLFILLLIVFTPPSRAVDDKPLISVQAALDKAFVTVGEPVVYTVTIRHDPRILVLTSAQPPSESILKIKKIDEFRDQDDDQVIEGKSITLTSFRLGEFILDPATIQYRDLDGSVKSVKTNDLYLTVKSVAEGEAKTDIRGNKPVMPIEPNYRWLFVLAGIIVTGVVLLIFIMWRKRTAVSLTEMHLEVQNPEQEAYQALNSLFDSDLIRRGKIKEYYSKLSEILRIYLERRFHILAIESTTYEIIHYLKKKNVEENLILKVDEVLFAADMAKFAKWIPEPTEVIDLNKKSKLIIDDSAKAQKEPADGV